MIPLHADLRWHADRDPFLARLTINRSMPLVLRRTEGLLLDSNEEGNDPLDGFQAVFVRNGDQAPPHGGSQAVPRIALPPTLGYLQAEDIVRVDPRRGDIRVLYRRQSPNNHFLVTERCNSKCLMCSQPPRDVQDGFLVEELLRAIPLISPQTEMIGFTGGEITLLHDQFLALLTTARNYLPATRVFCLTNGRLLAYLRYAERVAAVEHPNLILCVPLYSDIDSIHDFVVQAQGAFDESVRGILNLGRVSVPVEVRVVIHQQTFRRLPQLAEFIARNLPFVSHVALMGLEMTGFTKANLRALWIDPADYQQELSEAVETLRWAGLDVSIYNHQLCLLPKSLWPFAKKSISDWKNVYMPECSGCSVQGDCGGFFASAPLRYSDHICAQSVELS